MNNLTLLIDYSNHESHSEHFQKISKLFPENTEFVLSISNPSTNLSTQENITIATSSPMSTWTQALEKAKQNQSHLIYIKAPIIVSDKTVQSLSSYIEKDPMFGTSIPRFSSPNDLTWSLPTQERESSPKLTRRALASLPSYWIIPEILSGCILIRKELISNPPPHDNYITLLGCIQHLMCAARKRGFRQIISNSSIVTGDFTSHDIYPSLSDKDEKTFTEGILSNITYPKLSEKDKETVKKLLGSPTDNFKMWYQNHICHKLENLLVEAHPPHGQKRKILIDCRSMLAHFCGTTNSQIGLLKGFEHFTDKWEIHVIAQEHVIDAHKLNNQFPKLNISTKASCNYAATIHMSQPCFKGILDDLHYSAFTIGCNMLDTIAWDLIKGAPAEVEDVWNFTAQHFDCLFYISDFTKKQFNRRFPVSSNISEVTTYLSFAREENSSQKYWNAKEKNYILVFGNGYDHKDVLPTTLRLSKNFPKQQIIAFGPDHDNYDNVKFIQGGSLPDEKIKQLFAEAKAVVFPSWIEGFGMPVIEALSYGKNIVLRELELWNELAKQCTHLKGKMLVFNEEESLIEAVNNALKNKTTDALNNPSSTATPQIINWKKCAETILNGFENYIKTSTSEQWINREKTLSFYNK